jgi:hypothetical protein
MNLFFKKNRLIPFNEFEKQLYKLFSKKREITYMLCHVTVSAASTTYSIVVSIPNGTNVVPN